MRTMHQLSGIMIVAGLLSASEALGVTPNFQGLGDLPGGDLSSGAYGISADGSVVVGRSSSTSAPVDEAFRWTAAGGMVGLGFLPFPCPNHDPRSSALGVSGDGQVVVGGCLTTEVGGGDWGCNGEAYRWTAATGMVGLGVAGDMTVNTAAAISGEGSVIVGWGSHGGGADPRSWRWEGGVMTVMEDIGGGANMSAALGVSQDGSVIVGYGNSPSGQEAYRWTLSTGMVGLGDLTGGAYQSAAQDVSADGSVLVGWGTSGSGIEAFRWTAGGGMVGLGDLVGGAFESKAYGVSGDGGDIIVGAGTAGSGSESFIWDPVNGMRNLREVLINDYGLDLTGWSLREARAISAISAADGMTIAGWGVNPGGNTEAWIATMPEPVLSTITAWRSVREHGGLGNLAIELDASATGGDVVVEPRRGGIQRIEVDFDADVTEMLCGTVEAENLNFPGNTCPATSQMFINEGQTLVIEFADCLPSSETGLPDEICYRINLAANIAYLLGDTDCKVRGLAGDTNGNGETNLVDMAQTKSMNGADPSLPGNARFDVNVGGSIDLVDMALVKSLNGNSAPCP